MLGVQEQEVLINRLLIKTPADVWAAVALSFYQRKQHPVPSFEPKHKQAVSREQYERVKIYCWLL